jgi:hypothetical protein
MKPLWRCVVAIVVMGCVPACTSVRPAAGGHRLPEAFLADCQRLRFTPTKYILTVNIGRQAAWLFEDSKFVRELPCSTSRFGIGEVKNSFRTPRGLHRIAEKIGEGAPAGTIFRDRKVIGHIAQLGVKAGGITTRIMWLDGLDPGFNSGGNVDTHAREIYIHGTGDQASLGRPASWGCIHFADPDLMALYDSLPSGTLVWIAEK